MQFEEEFSSQLPSLQPSLATLIEQDRSQLSNSSSTIKFDTIVKFLNRFTNMRGIKKTNYAKQFITLLFKTNRSADFSYQIMRLLLPGDDRDRGNYGLKEKNMAKVIADSLNIPKEDYLRLHHYKNPSFHKSGVGIGDFSLCVYDVIKDYCRQVSCLTVDQLNQMLDQLAASSQNHITVFRKLFTVSNAEQIKWIVRIILKDLKISLKQITVLNTFHPDASDFFNLTNSLLQTCRKFENPSIRLDDQVKIFFPIRPMLAGKKKIGYFKENESKVYYVETKFDGERLQVHKRDDEVKLFSRNGVDYSKLYEIFVQIIKDHVQVSECILDGEIIVLEKESLKMAAFGMNKMVALNHDTDEFQLCYKIFDLLWLREEGEEINLMKFGLKQRKQMLQKIVKQQMGVIETVRHEQMQSYDQILKRFSDSIDRNQEGIMLKDPDSLYVPKERAANWIKLKGDYIDGLTDTLDLIILGGYYGDSSARHGSSMHWSDQITSFLLGVIDRIDSLNSKIAYAIPFAKVGTGYSLEELNTLRSKLRDSLIKNQGKFKPSYLECNWKPSLQDKPDCWVSSLDKSIILEIKAAELTETDNYPSGHTLRFPRVVKIRYDKDWNEAQTMLDLRQLTDSAVYSKHMRRKDDSDSDQDKSKKRQAAVEDKPVKKRKGERHRDEIQSEFIGFQMQNQRLVSHLFTGFQFCVLHQQNQKYSKLALERQIMLNDGTVVQNPMQSTQYIVTDVIDFKLRAFQKQKDRKYTFIKPNYIINCLHASKILPLSPLYLTVLPEGNAKYFMQNFDRFGDSYTSFLDLRELDQILESMNGRYAVNQKLIDYITLRYRRRGKVSLCFGLSELQKVKLRMHDNRIVNSFEEQPNSIIIDDKPTPQLVRRINEYKAKRTNVSIQFKEDLVASKIL